MSQDLLLDIGRNQIAREVVKKLRIPLRLPQTLHRDPSPWTDLPLQGMVLGIGGDRKSKSVELLRATVIAAGAQATHVYGSGARVHGLVFDATESRTVQDLGLLYDFIKPRLQTIDPCGRIVLIIHRADSSSDKSESFNPEIHAVSRAVVGFAKSLAKEVGKKGVTVNVIQTTQQNFTKQNIAWPLTYLLSDRSAFVSGQTLSLSQNPTHKSDSPFKESLKGKKALVTGAAHGIGKEICRWLTLEGAEVLGLDRPTEKQALAETMDRLNGKYLLADLMDPHSFSKIQMTVEKDYSSIDILVSNAGLTLDKTLGRMPRDYWDDVLQVNLKATMELIQSLVIKNGTPIRLLAPQGRVILMSSISGLSGNAGQTNYAAAKAGLIGYIEALAPLLIDHGITINGIAPGFIETRMTEQMPRTLREFARRFNALNQGGLPSDVAQAAAFLGSPGSSAITGQVLRVCGLNYIGA